MLSWVIATLCAFFVKGLCGFANTLVFTTALSFGNSNVNISPVELLLGYPTNAILAWKERHSIRWRVCLPLAVLVVLGSIPGILFLKNADTGLVKVLFGFVIVLLGVEMLWRERKCAGALGRENTNVVEVRTADKESEGETQFREEAERGTGTQSGKLPMGVTIIGVLSGILCGLYGVGALLGAYVGRVSENSHEFKGNICVVFLVENTLRVILYGMWGIITPDIFRQALVLVPVMLLGLFLGMVSGKILDERIVKKMVILMLIISGVALVWRSLV